MIFDIVNETDYDLVESMEIMLNKALDTVLSIESLSFDGEVSLLFVDDERIRELNRAYRNKDASTDVLSFPQYDSIIDNGVEDAYVYLGDVVISIDHAKSQAEEFGHSLEREIIYLAVHSLLHLLGYDHMEDQEKLRMRTQEKKILKELQIFK
jgi:probable rRNA maturation factor